MNRVLSRRVVYRMIHPPPKARLQSTHSYFRLLAVLLLIAVPSPLHPSAQSLPVGDELETYARLLQLTGISEQYAFSVRPLPFKLVRTSITSGKEHPWIHWASRYGPPSTEWWNLSAADPQIDAYWNSTLPSGRNDGVVWQGRGITTSVVAGLFGRVGPLSVSLRPRLLYVQNSGFQLSTLPVAAGRSRFAYPMRLTIDMPQRFGPNPFAVLDPGQSFVQLAYGQASIGVSNENLWWGPGIRNAIVMSNNAPGFRHLYIGTDGPANIWIGHIQSRWVWGYLAESDYFDEDSTNDQRFLTGIVLDYSPRWIDGLSVGFSRVFVMNAYPERPSASEYVIVFQSLFKRSLSTPENPSGLDNRDQVASVFGRFVLPESGFEIYGEFAKGDHNWDTRDLVVEPEHASAYTVGFQKVIEHKSRRFFRLTAELNRLEAPKNAMIRGVSGGAFYLHERVVQGYTNRGQVLGAGIGPGSNAQFIGVDHYIPSGRVGVYIERIVFDNDRRYDNPAFAHEVSLRLGLDMMLRTDAFEIRALVEPQWLMNRDYVRGRDVANMHATLQLRYNMGGIR